MRGGKLLLLRFTSGGPIHSNQWYIIFNTTQCSKLGGGGGENHIPPPISILKVWFGLLGFNASATARVISRR